MKRIDEMTTPPEPSRFYRVPTVQMPMFGFLDIWPVIGPWHEDREMFGFEPYHVHLDVRFLTKAQQCFIERWITHVERDWVAEAQAMPLHWPQVSTDDGLVSFEEPPEIVYRRKKCQASGYAYRHRGKSAIVRLTESMQGARLGPKQICPHRDLPLGSIAHDSDGVITCPGHGLRWCAESGRLLGQRQTPDSSEAETRI